MRWRIIYIIMMKEIREALQAKYVLFSVVFMPILMGIILPYAELAPFVGMSAEELDVEGINIPGLEFTTDWSNLDDVAKFFIIMIESLNILFLLIPMILPTVIAADTFSGEKERNTAEALVAAPVSDTEIYLGKIASSLAPTLVSTYVVGIIYVLLINYITRDVFTTPYLPNPTFIGLVVFLGPLMALATVNFMIWVSTRTTSTRDASQLGGVIVLPLMGVMVGTIGLSAWLGDYVVWIVIVAMILVDIILIKIGISILDREKWVR